MKVCTTGMAFMAILSLSFFTACRKDQSGQACQATVAGISGSYKLTALQYKRNSSATPADYLALMDACEKDDIIILKPNGTYDSNDIGISCTPGGSNSGTWSISGNVITSDGIVNGIIESYDCNKLVCYVEDTNIPGDRLTITLVRQ